MKACSMPMKTVSGIRSCWFGWTRQVADKKVSGHEVSLFSHLFQLLEGGGKKLYARNFLRGDGTPSTFTVSRQRIHEQSDDQDGHGDTCQVDGRDFEDFRVWRSFQVRVVRRLNHAEVGAAKIECRVRVVSVIAAARSVGPRRQDQAGNQVSPKFGGLPCCWRQESCDWRFLRGVQPYQGRRTRRISR